VIWLASFPRSGNTFLRIVLHEVYGVGSSTFHKEPAYPVKPDYDRYAVVKTHLLPQELVPADPAIPAVYIVRDGRDALVSIAHHRSNLVAPGSDLRRNLIEAIVADDGSHFGGWSVNVSQWLRRASLVIRFEDLIRDPIACAERLRPFLDLPAPRRDKLPSFEDLRTKDMPYGSGVQHGFSPEERAFRRRIFFRRGAVGAWKNEMPEELHHLFWKRHGAVMRELGYARDQSLISKTRGSFAWEWAAFKGRLVKACG
jgi:hypothetical protein